MIFTFDVQSYKALYVKWTLFKHPTVEAEPIFRGDDDDVYFVLEQRA